MRENYRVSIHGHRVKKPRSFAKNVKWIIHFEEMKKQAHEHECCYERERRTARERERASEKKELPKIQPYSSAILLVYLFIFLTFIRRICRFYIHFMWIFTCVFFRRCGLRDSLDDTYRRVFFCCFFISFSSASMRNLHRKTKKVWRKLLRTKILTSISIVIVLKHWHSH